MASLPQLEFFTRAGFAARGIMYGLIGFLALRTGRNGDGADALQYLAGETGRIVLGLMAAGFLGYGLWRLSEAALDTEGHGSDAKGIAVRAGGAVSGLIHLGLAFVAVKLAAGSGGGGGNSAQEGTAMALGLPGGGLLVAAAGAILLVVGGWQIARAIRGDFLKHLDSRAARREWVSWLGRGGYAARGIVFLAMAWFVAKAAWASDAGAAGGMGEALASLPDTVRTAVAAGLFLFGLFSLVEARHRKINDPAVIERLKAMR
ncbi:MAG TPA: DUF1206 domain-containing protein [Allosphingosinicella sp.]|nr:DUF1206 domain-containing protein [Allosphingosinicella sp.]